VANASTENHVKGKGTEGAINFVACYAQLLTRLVSSPILATGKR